MRSRGLSLISDPSSPPFSLYPLRPPAPRSGPRVECRGPRLVHRNGVVSVTTIGVNCDGTTADATDVATTATAASASPLKVRPMILLPVPTTAITTTAGATISTAASTTTTACSTNDSAANVTAAHISKECCLAPVLLSNLDCKFIIFFISQLIKLTYEYFFNSTKKPQKYFMMSIN